MTVSETQSEDATFSFTEINLWFDESTYGRLSSLTATAAGLFGDGAGGELGENAEYERGIVELICESHGISPEHREDVLKTIHAVATESGKKNT